MGRKSTKSKFILDEAKKNEIWAIVFLVVAILIFISLISFDINDISFHTSTPNIRIRNFAGIVGAYLGWALYFLVGLSSYCIPVVILFWAVGRFVGTRPQRFYVKLIGTLVLILATSTLLSMLFYEDPAARFQKGGIAGLALSDILIRYFGKGGSFTIGIALLLLSLLLATEFLIFPFVLVIIRWIKNLFFVLRDLMTGFGRKKKIAVKAPLIIKSAQTTTTLPPKPIVKPEKVPLREVTRIRVDKPKPAPVVKPVVKKAIPVGDYKLPSLNLLESPPPIEERKIREDLQINSRILEETLADFDVEAKVVQVNQGPVITRYELEPAPGVKVNRITALSDDIALAMKAQSVRIVAPIPGKAAVGVEVPNSSSTLVYLKEILESPDFQNSSSKLTMALGKDIAGTPIITDLGDMPHLLIAGATGSGKTVCVNAIITSMLFQATPDEVKFLMVDPKMVELAIFNDLPHLLCPVVTEHKKVSAALDWVVNEMESRYKLFAKVGARNIDIYNQRTETRVQKPEEESQEEYSKLPYIIVIIDELADLMAIAQREIENAIQRLAQLSRAVGIHIILATQRPSVDVITGVIKANFPARISFKVASKVDSRTVLDMNGADKLLGKGDMLFIEPGASKPIRAQGSLVTDAEIERVVKFAKSQRTPQYSEDILSEQTRGMTMKKFEKDEIYDEAVRVILETRQASVSILQRRIGLGYTRAARIIDMMEQEGIVGPYQGSKPREILVDKVERKEKVEEKSS